MAFRQAKVAMFFERRGVGLFDLARFEGGLTRRLFGLQKLLRRGDGWFSNCPVGDVYLVPKRLKHPEKPTPQVVEVRPIRAASPGVGLELQLRLAPTPEFATIEVLYLWRFGPFLDRLVPRESIGYRLLHHDGVISRTKRWLFEYWRRRYQQFRTEPIDVALKELRAGRGNVTIVTADLAGFYDTVAASFLLSDSLIAQLQAHGMPASDVEEYRRATQTLIAAYANCRQRASRLVGFELATGIPIGALTSRVVANAALATFDDAVSRVSTVLCYRRYVDDFVIIARSPRNDAPSFADTLARHVPHVIRDGEDWRLDCLALHRTGCEFKLQERKIKIHRLSGVQGEEYLGAIARDFGALVSESRAFVDSAVLNDGDSARLFGVGKADGSPIRVLRDADRAKLQHFSVSIGLRSIEQVSLLINVRDARAATLRTLERLATHVAGEIDWAEHLDLAFRIFGLAVSLANWKTSRTLNRWMDETWGTSRALHRSVGTLSLRGTNVISKSAWDNLRRHLQERRIETISSVVRVDHQRDLPPWLSIRIDGRTRIDRRGFLMRARALAAADLRKRDREDDFEGLGKHSKRRPALKLPVFGRGFENRLRDIRLFIDTCRNLGGREWVLDPVRLFLSTRPPSYFDIARRWLHRVDDEGFGPDAFDRLLELVNAIRGTAYADPVGRVIDQDTVQVPSDQTFVITPDADPTIALGNLTLKTEYLDGCSKRVAGAAFGSPVLTVERLTQLGNVLDHAAHLCRFTDGAPSHKACLLVLPELSLPRAWFRATANHAIKTGRFGVVVGLEYLHDVGIPTVRNQAYVVLPGPFASVATWPFTKRVAAREEALLLRARRPALRFSPTSGTRRPRTVVDSPYGRLSVLICSELIEARLVAGLLGRVEMIVSPSWNTDTASYDHLIQSVGLQLHAIVAVANNGHYSDCRIWAPLSERWRRDLCRLIERDGASIVSVEIPLKSLQHFQAAQPRQVAAGPIRSQRSDWRPLPPDWP